MTAAEMVSADERKAAILALIEEAWRTRCWLRHRNGLDLTPAELAEEIGKGRYLWIGWELVSPYTITGDSMRRMQEMVKADEALCAKVRVFLAECEARNNRAGEAE